MGQEELRHVSLRVVSYCQLRDPSTLINITKIELKKNRKKERNKHRTAKAKKQEVLTLRFSSLSQSLLCEGSLQI